MRPPVATHTCGRGVKVSLTRPIPEIRGLPGLIYFQNGSKPKCCPPPRQR